MYCSHFRCYGGKIRIIFYFCLNLVRSFCLTLLYQVRICRFNLSLIMSVTSLKLSLLVLEANSWSLAFKDRGTFSIKLINSSWITAVIGYYPSELRLWSWYFHTANLLLLLALDHLTKVGSVIDTTSAILIDYDALVKFCRALKLVSSSDQGAVVGLLGRTAVSVKTSTSNVDEWSTVVRVVYARLSI